MELTSLLLRWGAGRPHLLLAEVPGGAAVRLAVEQVARKHRWPVAASPADADVLVVCGVPDAVLREAVETTWRAMPGPRARVERTEPAATPTGIERAVAQLRDAVAQRADADTRPVAAQEDPASEAEAERTESDHGGMDHGDMQMDMSMSLPGGLVMADRADDRDGLKLDVLHLRLGPFSPAWPPGLCLDVVLQGDVVQEAVVEVHVMPGAVSGWIGRSGDAGGLLAAAHLDSAGQLLRLAGWGVAADVAATLRDAALAGAPAQDLRRDVARLQVRVARAWSVRWGLRGLGVLRSAQARRLGVTGPALRADGDAYDRLLQWLHEAAQALDGAAVAGEGPRGRVVDGRPASAALLDALSTLVTGLDVAGARLVVASLDPDVAELAPAAARG